MQTDVSAIAAICHNLHYTHFTVSNLGLVTIEITSSPEEPFQEPLTYEEKFIEVLHSK